MKLTLKQLHELFVQSKVENWNKTKKGIATMKTTKKSQIEWAINEHKNELEIYLDGALDQTISEVYSEKEGLELVKEHANEKGIKL